MRAFRCSLYLALLASPARAGDPPAHTSAMLKAAYDVSRPDEFALGVGAPLVKGMRKQGQFVIPVPTPAPPGGISDENMGATPWECPLDSPIVYPKGCSYQELNGLAVNEPDDWSCRDKRQPPQLKAINSNLAPIQSRIADALAWGHVIPQGVACNYTHFASNLGVPSAKSANTVGDLALDWAYSIPDGIVTNGATAKTASCSVDGWNEYYRRVANALHFYQDAECEHHEVGNLFCNASDAIPIFVNPGDLYKYARALVCRTWVDSTVADSIGFTPRYWCDDEVAEGQHDFKSLSQFMTLAHGFCQLGLPFACMGLERTLRHHCNVDSSHSLLCDGPPNDHKGSMNTQQYCEGERFNDGGGDDYLGMAASKSVEVLQPAMQKWADVCKEPDDPCLPAKCDQWCKRSVVKKNTAGYCVNDQPAPDCLFHKCVCGDKNQCGKRNQPCCGGSCGGGLECSMATGKCVPTGEGKCTPKVLLSPGMARLSCAESQGFRVKLEPPDWPTANLSYEFSNGASVGHLTASDGAGQDHFETKQPTVTYQAKDGSPQGTDTLSVEVFSSDTDAAGKLTKRSLGKATATAEVGSACVSTDGYIGSVAYNSGCVTQLSAPTTVHPGDKITVSAQTNCGGAAVSMSNAVSASLDGGPEQTGGGYLTIYDFCYYGSAQPFPPDGASVTLPDNDAHSIVFTIDPALKCSVCAKEVDDGVACYSNSGNHVNLDSPAVVMSGSGGTHGWSALRFFEIQVPTK